MLKLAHSEHLFALILVGVALLLFISYLVYRSRIISKLGKKQLVKDLMATSSLSRKYLKFSLAFLGLTFLIIAWANPLVGTKYEKVKREGIDVLFAIDVSKSMDAKDVIPSRMLKAKQVVSNAIDAMSNDRIGLIVFAGNAYLQMPVTVDYSGAKMYLKTIDTDIVPKQGTAIGEAIDLAISSFDIESEGYKTLVIISDGEDHDGDAEAMIQKAKKEGITIHTIGVGSEQAAPIPINNKGDFKKDNEGNIVMTKLNEDMLSDLAIQAEGQYFNASSSDLTQNLLATLGGQEGRMVDEKVFTSFKNHFPLFLGIAFVLLLIDFLIVEKKSKKLGF